MSFQRRRRSSHTMPEISLTPLIDTALVLLVIFMIATPIMQNSLHIELPKGHMKEDTGQQRTSLVVSIDSGKQLRLNNEPMELAVLLKELETRAAALKETKVYIQCDHTVSSGNLVNTIDAIKYVAGVEHVVLSTEKAR